MKVGVSFLSIEENLDEKIIDIDKSNCDYIHVDMMDGNFVPNANFTVQDIKKICKNCEKPLDIHMMVSSPNKYVKDFAKMKNVEYLTFHYEAHRRPIDVVNMIRHTNMKVGIAINPETKVSHIVPLLNHIDQVLVMSVKPGFGGQKFMEEILYKIETLRDIREENGYHYVINVDGGINDETVKLVKDAGADMVVAGSYICNSKDYNENIEKLRGSLSNSVGGELDTK